MKCKHFICHQCSCQECDKLKLNILELKKALITCMKRDEEYSSGGLILDHDFLEDLLSNI